MLADVAHPAPAPGNVARAGCEMGRGPRGSSTSQAFSAKALQRFRLHSGQYLQLPLLSYNQFHTIKPLTSAELFLTTQICLASHA